MQVSQQNNVKIYNLSAGKSLPEWLSDRQRRNLLRKDVDIRRRIELIQDFDMPALSTTVKCSNDGQYILATGIYKPRVKCWDVHNLSLKFERCFDAEAVTFDVLSEDYSKLVFLQCDRYIEIHAAHGRHHRLRMPRVGHDMTYNRYNCDLYVVGASSDIYRLNLERGQFLEPFPSQFSVLNKCSLNPIHNLLMCGGQEGKVGAWDPRSKTQIGQLDCALNCTEGVGRPLKAIPSITALQFNSGALTLGVGTATGQVLLYDIRARKPFLLKDHMYDNPIRDIKFHYQQDLVLSLDPMIVKIWNKNDGHLMTFVESPNVELHNLCTVRDSGLFFLSNEGAKIQTYYIPSLGPAPKWCSFLDSLTEELEETNTETLYDDYKFVTKSELDTFGLDHLIGTNLLRAYMHGYFMDIRLYNKAKSLSNPFEFDRYRRDKIRETIETERTNRVQITDRVLPTVNAELAVKLSNHRSGGEKLLTDDRFKALFENPDFQIDTTSIEYRLINPVVAATQQKRTMNGEKDRTWRDELRRQYKLIRREERQRQNMTEAPLRPTQPELIALNTDVSVRGALKHPKINRVSLGERVKSGNVSNVKYVGGSMGNREMTFSTCQKRQQQRHNVELKNRHHVAERKRLVRKAPTRGRFKRPFV